MNGEVKGNIPLLTGSRAFSLGFQPLQVIAIVPCSNSRILYASWRSRDNGRRFLKLDKRSVDETQPPRFYLRLKA